MTPHNSATTGTLAKTVLFPGDPERAAWVADAFLENAIEVTHVRGMRGFTGMYQGTSISVMASGMGGPSAGIYSYELFSVYEVDTIIRIGTSGGLQEYIAVGDLVFALTASTDSAWAHQYQLQGTFSPAVSYPLIEAAVRSARDLQVPYHAGMVFSSDLFSDYNALGPDSWKAWARMGALVQDMETYALYSTAAYTGKKALSILTMTDSCVTGKGLEKEQRMSALAPMIRVALQTAINSGAVS
ncbi:MAG: purine-nucleoside phosphorylase [Sphaerochaetaceae bacterium]|nr:purine-nucleoside phosphorylase [Sphaerochaetaceae bacterium]